MTEDEMLRFGRSLVQLTDEFVDTAMPGIGGVEGLRRQLMQVRNPFALANSILSPGQVLSSV